MGEYLSIETAKKLASINKTIKFIKQHKSEIKYADELLKILETKKEINVFKNYQK